MANLILLTDSYKQSHWMQYPPGTQFVHSYFESRGGFAPETTFFGLQYFLKKYVAKGFCLGDIREAADMCRAHFGGPLFNKDGWARLYMRHGRQLPISIRAVPEGMTLPTRSVLMTVENTDPEFPWLTNFLETLLVQVWYPMTVATLSREMKRLILKFRKLTSEDMNVDFSLHDFGFRGVSSVESAGIGGLAHLVNFRGTDTMEALVTGRDYYGEPCAGFSIPAAEHSTITSWGRDNEVGAYENMLDRYPTGPVAVVSDSYDIYDACDRIWGGLLRDRVMARNGVVIIRPDSGYPPTVVRKVLSILWDKFGGTTNSRGFKVLDPHVRVIQGDGIDYDMTQAVLVEAMRGGFSAENIAFGMGGGLLQKLNRDTQRCAFKCSWIQINGEGRDVYKDPVTDEGKTSKRGRFDADPNLREVFRDGKILVDDSLATIRDRAAVDLTSIA